MDTVEEFLTEHQILVRCVALVAYVVEALVVCVAESLWELPVRLEEGGLAELILGVRDSHLQRRPLKSWRHHQLLGKRLFLALYGSGTLWNAVHWQRSKFSRGGRSGKSGQLQIPKQECLPCSVACQLAAILQSPVQHEKGNEDHEGLQVPNSLIIENSSQLFVQGIVDWGAKQYHRDAYEDHIGGWFQNYYLFKIQS